jgi:hypothetical protein
LISGKIPTQTCSSFHFQIKYKPDFRQINSKQF